MASFTEGNVADNALSESGFPLSTNNSALVAQTLPAAASRNQQAYSNPRSCVTCRRRKVRCNKIDPCSNCVKAGISCIFPLPGRATRKLRRSPDAELLARLRRLEGMVESFHGGSVEGSVASNLIPAPSTAKSPERDDKDYRPSLPNAGMETIRPSPHRQEELGKLVFEEGRSRYVSDKFWASLGDQVSRYTSLTALLAFSTPEDGELHTAGR
jgi:Fungal Zn(2)-Cys(6) binuclear cluster domain